MSIFFTSDTHFSHANILHLGQGRPFKNIQHHNEMLIKYWNETVMPDDVVYHFGDVALGPWHEGLDCVARLNGYKKLIPGNHDRIFSGMSKTRQANFIQDYRDVFQEVLPEIIEEEFDGIRVRISHFPAEEVQIAGEADRYVKNRPVDDGTPIIHGHTHQQDVVTFTPRGTMQVSVGVDANNWRPVTLESVLERIHNY